MRDYLLSFDPAYEKYLADDQTLSPDESRIAQVIIAVRGAIPALLAFRNVRGAFGAIPADWDDPAMDVYDGLPEGGALADRAQAARQRALAYRAEHGEPAAVLDQLWRDFDETIWQSVMDHRLDGEGGADGA